MTSPEYDIDEAIAHLRKADRKLAAVIDEIGPLKLSRARSGFPALARIITGQQLSGKAAATIYRRVCAALPGKRMTMKGIKAVTDRVLRAAGLSAAKTRALRDLVEKIESGELPVRRFRKMTDAEVSEAVVRVRGLGPWSAQMYLMFVLQRPDVFAAGDLGIQNAIARIYGIKKKPDDLEKFARRWRPYRTLACRYLWASLRNAPLNN